MIAELFFLFVGQYFKEYHTCMKTDTEEAFTEVMHSDTNPIMLLEVLLSLRRLHNFSARTDQQQSLQQKLFHTAEKTDF